MKSATAKTNVVLVDAVRTPFGKAGSLYAGTRADAVSYTHLTLPTKA